MNNALEVRWHGRGGQGAKTAALLLAELAYEAGRRAQGFPEYGPERMGAPITAYTRVSDAAIRTHSNVYEPDLVAVLDETLLGSVDVTRGLKEGGRVVVNTSSTSAQAARLLGLPESRVVAVDASGIAKGELGKPIPNVPMLAAVVRASGLLPRDEFLAALREAAAHKFASKPGVVDANVRAAERAYGEAFHGY